MSSPLRLWRDPIVRTVVKLALPAIAQQLLHTLEFLVDRAMLGAYGGTALASMQLSGPLVWSVFAVLGAFAMGTVAFVGRAAGAGDRELGRAGARASLLFALGVGLLTTAFGVPLSGWMATALAGGNEAAVVAESTRFLRVIFGASPALFVGATAGAIVQASGNTRVPFLVTLGANLLNIVGNWLLIFGHMGMPRLGTTGAAISTSLAFCVEAVALTAFVASRHSVVGIRGGPRREWREVRPALVRILRVSLPTYAEKAIYHAGFLIFVGIIATLGRDAMAGNQALVSIESISFLSADGVGIAAAAVVAQRLGARSPSDAHRGAMVSLALGVALLGVFGLSFGLGAHTFVSAFTRDSAIVSVAVPCMYVAACAQPFMAAGMVLSQVLRGAGETRTPLVVSLVCAVGVRLVATWIAARVLHLGLLGVWIGSTCDWLARTLLLTIAYRRGRWRRVVV